MKKQFERQEGSIDRKLTDMNTAMEKNQESIMNAIKCQVDSLQKHQEDKVEQAEGAKHARCGSNEDEFKDYMDELEDCVHVMQMTQGTPLDRGSSATMATSCR
eukprot:7463998-Ditylum_brightwellii.AAC.1